MARTVIRSGSRRRKPDAYFQWAIIQYLKAQFGPKVWISNHVGGIGQRGESRIFFSAWRGASWHWR